MESRVITITPERAKLYLSKNNERNRNINHAVVKRYAQIMRAGGWNLTHQGIAFDDKGVLIDGQHRLAAIIMANVPVEMMVTFNVLHADGEAFTIDVGRRRTTQNIMQISGIDDSVYKNMARFVALYMRMKAKRDNTTPEPSEIIAYTERHYDALKHIADIIGAQHGGASGTLHMPTIVGAALMSAYYRGESPDALRKFVDVYRRNNIDDCERYNARHALNLREYVRAHKTTKETFQRCECSIYAFCHNTTRLTICERYPFDVGLDG